MSSSTSNSRPFPKAFLAAIILFCLTVVTGVGYMLKTDTLPAPLLSGRFSFDEKLRFMRHNKSNYESADFIVLGSSTGLNNFSSKVMMNHPEVKASYFNYSAWGFTTHGILDYWKFLERIVTKPKVFILSIDLNQFHDYHQDLNIDETDVLSYLDGQHPFPYYVKYHQAGFVDRARRIPTRRNSNRNFDSIMFDAGGGVLLNVSEDDPIAQKKWREEYTPKFYSKSAYQALDDLLNYLNEQGIATVIVQNPLREPLFGQEPDFQFVYDHWNKVDYIAQKYQVPFFNMQGIFPESQELFSDSVHLSKQGAHLFTEHLLQRIHQAGIFHGVSNSTYASIE